MRFRFFCFLLLPILAHAQRGFYEPWGTDADLKYLNQEQQVDTTLRSLAVRTAEQIILFHQRVLSPVDGPRSHFRPSSSSYMLQAMQKHGFIEGFLMGCDRLMRENDDKWVYRTINEEGKLFKYDPVR